MDVFFCFIALLHSKSEKEKSTVGIKSKVCRFGPLNIRANANLAPAAKAASEVLDAETAEKEIEVEINVLFALTLRMPFGYRGKEKQGYLSG